MNLLQFANESHTEGSFNCMLAKFVRKVRHYREVYREDIESVMPELLQMEAVIQKIDESLGERRCFYIKEILAELDEEAGKN